MNQIIEAKKCFSSTIKHSLDDISMYPNHLKIDIVTLPILLSLNNFFY